MSHIHFKMNLISYHTYILDKYSSNTEIIVHSYGHQNEYLNYLHKSIFSQTFGSTLI